MNISEYRSDRPPAGYRDELIHGEILLSPSPKREHADLCSTLYDLIKPLLHADFIVRFDTTHLLGLLEGPRPYVFVINLERWVISQEGYPEGSSELAIEVWSESNTAEEMRTKRELYFSDPRCLEIWEVKHSELSVLRYRRNEVTSFGPADSLIIPSQIGTGSVSVRDIFAGIAS